MLRPFYLVASAAPSGTICLIIKDLKQAHCCPLESVMGFFAICGPLEFLRDLMH